MAGRLRGRVDRIVRRLLGAGCPECADPPGPIRIIERSHSPEDDLPRTPAPLGPVRCGSCGRLYRPAISVIEVLRPPADADPDPSRDHCPQQ
jgi:hypothetical protein